MKTIALLIVCSALSARSAIIFYGPSQGGGELGWQLALLANSITTTSDPLSLNPEQSLGSGIVNDMDFWSSANILIRPEVTSPLGIDYAVINEGVRVDVSTNPQSVIALEPGITSLFGPPATGFNAFGFNYTKTQSYSVQIYVRTIGDTGYSLAPSSIGPTDSGFWGFIADDPADAIDSIVFVQTAFPGPGPTEFSMSDIRVTPIPEPSALLLALLALPPLLRRKNKSKDTVLN